MATLQKIVLAIASSWNNETSSPAPQGNRALSNQTNALASAFAERQAQPSAKTPPPPNRIGKGIGKFWISILLIAATALTTIPIEQAGAWWTQDEDGNVRSGPTPPAPVQPVAVPLPVVVVAKPVLKKGAIVAGKWLIAVLAEYGVHTALDRVFQNNKDQEANVTVHGSRWLSHEYSHQVKTPTPSIPPYGGNWTTTADMGDRNELNSAFGWWGNLNQSMTHDEAIDILDNKMAKVSIVRLDMSYWDPTARVRGKSGRLYPVVVIGHQFWAREDRLATVKSRELRKIRQNTGNPRIVWYKELQRETFKWNVGSFGMFSDFVDPAPILKALGTENAIDSDANYYKATATWKTRYIGSTGRFYRWKDREEDFDEIKSWEDHHFSHDFCRNNYEITEPAIYEGIRRFISKRPVYEKTRRRGQMRRGGDYYWKRVGWEPVVAQEYQDLN